jgi:hypothetical protein
MMLFGRLGGMALSFMITLCLTLENSFISSLSFQGGNVWRVVCHSHWKHNHTMIGTINKLGNILKWLDCYTCVSLEKSFVPLAKVAAPSELCFPKYSQMWEPWASQSQTHCASWPSNHWGSWTFRGRWVNEGCTFW